MHQQIRHFFKLAVRRQVRNVVSAIVQIVAAVTHGAERRDPAGVPESATDFLGLKAAGADVASLLISTPRRASS